MNMLIISQMFPCKRHPTSAVFFANLMKELAAKGHDLTIVTPRPYIPKLFHKRWKRWHLDPMTSEADGMRIIRPYVVSFPGSAFATLNVSLMHLGLFRLVRELIRQKNVELILGYNMLPEGFAAVRLGRTFGLPSAFWAIGSDVNDVLTRNCVNAHFVRKHIPQSDLVLTESKDLQRKLSAFVSKRLPIRTYYKGIDISNFQNLPPRDVLVRKMRLQINRRYLLFVGRLIQDKGIYELVQAFRVLAKRYPDVDLIFVGEEIERQKLLLEIVKAGLARRVQFTGIVPYNQIAQYIKIADVLVFPSWAEGLPNVVMEAMAVGLPVVASDVGGIPEIIRNRVTGLLVPPRNVEKLADALNVMMQDKQLRDTCTENAKILMRAKFDVKNNVDELDDLLKNLKADSAKTRVLHRNAKSLSYPQSNDFRP